MASTQLSNLIVPSVFVPYVQVLTSQLNVFVASGIMVTQPSLSTFLQGGGERFSAPFYVDVDDTEANISNDNPASNATPSNITATKQDVQRHNLNRAWGSMDLNIALTGTDPMQAIARRVAAYWARQQQRRLISSLRGVFADNIANDAGDMVLNISAGGVNAPTAANRFSAEAALDAMQTAGDNQFRFSGIAMHSVVYNRAQKNNLIDFIPDSEGRVEIPTFLGKRVTVDDGLPVVTNGVNLEYHTYLFGAGSVVYGEEPPENPVETDRLPLSGGGGGQDILVSRTQFAMHPNGISWLAASQAARSPSLAELATAANWNRVYPERKQIRLALLITNG